MQVAMHSLCQQLLRLRENRFSQFGHMYVVNVQYTVAIFYLRDSTRNKRTLKRIAGILRWKANSRNIEYMDRALLCPASVASVLKYFATWWVDSLRGPINLTKSILTEMFDFIIIIVTKWEEESMHIFKLSKNQSVKSFTTCDPVSSPYWYILNKPIDQSKIKELKEDNEKNSEKKQEMNDNFYFQK